MKNGMFSPIGENKKKGMSATYGLLPTKKFPKTKTGKFILTCTVAAILA
jgi:hypothetical protein